LNEGGGHPLLLNNLKIIMKNFAHLFLLALIVYSVVIKTFIMSSIRSVKKVNVSKLRKKTVSSRIEKIWKGRFQNIPNKFFGHGCNHKFEHYISGKSNVKIHDIDDLCEWLLTCKYIPDFIKHNERDHWSHPDEFEYEKRVTVKTLLFGHGEGLSKCIIPLSLLLENGCMMMDEWVRMHG